MFEIAEITPKIEKEDYKAQVPELREQLIQLQHHLKTADFSVVIVLTGLEAGGRSETLHKLYEWMDARFLTTHAAGEVSDEVDERPYFWRFWRALPPRGRIGLFLGGWYAHPLIERFRDKIDDDALDTAMRHIRNFEEALVEDGTLVLKFWFHLSRQAQKKRVKKLEKDPESRWRVQPVDHLLVKHHEEYRRIAERALRETNTAKTPWVIVNGADARGRQLTVARDLAAALAMRLRAQTPAPTPVLPATGNGVPRVSILARLDLTQKLDKDEYKQQLEEYQGQLHVLSRQAYRKGLSTVLVFEGWDAAGKGGIVRRLVSALDPRDYSTVPVAAPSDEEKAHHYLWRFWRHLPRAGHLVLFDRSWYGRVLVERVEGFAREDEWQRAYSEINDFEQQMAEHGMLIVKFWLHIDKDEQGRRFQEREQTPFKRYKITQDDYRNRERWDDYDRAVNDMVERCSTEFAPWHLIEANDKHFARIKVLKTLCKGLEERL